MWIFLLLLDTRKVATIEKTKYCLYSDWNERGKKHVQHVPFFRLCRCCYSHSTHSHRKNPLPNAHKDECSMCFIYVCLLFTLLHKTQSTAAIASCHCISSHFSFPHSVSRHFNKSCALTQILMV